MKTDDISLTSRREILKLAATGALVNPQVAFSKKKSAAANKDAPNILILVFDALSALNSSLYGYSRQTTPNLARFADKAIVYHSHYSTGNFTSPGTASLLTGTYPWTHRAIHLHGEIEERLVGRNVFNQFGNCDYTRVAYSHNYLVMSLLWQFRDDLETLKWTRELCISDDQVSDLVFSNDFNVAFWSEWLTLRGSEIGPGSTFLSVFQRLLRAFHKQSAARQYGRLFPRGVPNLHNSRFVLEDAIDWMAEQLSSLPRPYLVYVHVLPPHEPYTTRREFIDIFDDGWAPPKKAESFFSQGHSEEFLLRNRREYDEYLAYADAEFGRLLDFMIKQKIIDDTYIIVTSDHGELFERGIRGHVTETLHEPVIRVPLVISQPGLNSRVDIHSATSSVDILPTLLSIAGKSIPEWCEGEVLPPFALSRDQERQIFAVEAKGSPKRSPLARSTVALIKSGYKLVQYRGYGNRIPRYELYNLARDPEEHDDLSQPVTKIFGELRESLDEKIAMVNHSSS